MIYQFWIVFCCQCKVHVIVSEPRRKLIQSDNNFSYFIFAICIQERRESKPKNYKVKIRSEQMANTLNGEMPKVIASHWLARLKVIRHYFSLFIPTSHRFLLHTFVELQFHSFILNLLLLRMHPDDSAWMWWCVIAYGFRSAIADQWSKFLLLMWRRQFSDSLFHILLLIPRTLIFIFSTDNSCSYHSTLEPPKSTPTINESYLICI